MVLEVSLEAAITKQLLKQILGEKWFAAVECGLKFTILKTQFLPYSLVNIWAIVHLFTSVP